jgi:hypothetical protein
LLLRYDPKTKHFTGEERRAHVTYIAYGPSFGIPPGYCVMSIELEKDRALTAEDLGRLAIPF